MAPIRPRGKVGWTEAFEVLPRIKQIFINRCGQGLILGLGSEQGRRRGGFCAAGHAAPPPSAAGCLPALLSPPLPVAPAVGGGVTAQPAWPRHVAWGDAISNLVFLTPLCRGCGFCGRASKVPHLPFGATMTSWKWGGEALSPQTPGGKWETFSTSCPTSGY